jgi:tRNA 5-methylaminomethyl-2-thiouridine biosynthesis bifunctional protein
VQDIEVNLKTYVPSLDVLWADAVVLACGLGVLGFYPMMPLKAVRGQVTMVKANTESAKLKTNLCYGGYTSAPMNGVHMVGSTFQRWLAHTDLLQEDDADNLGKLSAHVPHFTELEVIGARAALRTTSADHFPIAGKIERNIYVSTAHGSHGILSSLMAAGVITDTILARKSSLGPDVLKSLSPDRF